MMNENSKNVKPSKMEQVAQKGSQWMGSSLAFAVATLLSIVWLIMGPFFNFSDSWQLVINTVSSVITFLAVFLIQRSQNKDTLSMQIKLNEIVAALQGASNRVIAVEDLSEDEVRKLHERYQSLATKVQDLSDLKQSISIEEEKH